MLTVLRLKVILLDNYPETVKWYRKVVEQGNTNAKKRLVRGSVFYQVLAIFSTKGIHNDFKKNIMDDNCGMSWNDAYWLLPC